MQPYTVDNVFRLTVKTTTSVQQGMINQEFVQVVPVAHALCQLKTFLHIYQRGVIPVGHVALV